MIFTAEQARLILNGRKTQTRRRVVRPAVSKHHPDLRPGVPDQLRTSPTLEMTREGQLQRTSHREGRIYRLERHARGDEMPIEQRYRVDAGRERAPVVTVGHIQCTILALQRLGDITLKDARAEGHRTTVEFKTGWTLSREPRLTLDEEALISRFDDRHADKLVWVLEFNVVEQPRLVKASYSGDNYTDVIAAGLRLEPEAISDDDATRLALVNTAADYERRRAPLVTHPNNMLRELDEMRNRMTEDGVPDRGLKKAIRETAFVLERLKEKTTT